MNLNLKRLFGLIKGSTLADHLMVKPVIFAIYLYTEIQMIQSDTVNACIIRSIYMYIYIYIYAYIYTYF